MRNEISRREDEKWVGLKRRGWEIFMVQDKRMRLRNEYGKREEDEKWVW